MECLQEAIDTPIAIVSVDKMQQECSESADSDVPIGCYVVQGFDNWEGEHDRHRLWKEYGANTVEADIRRRLR